VPIFVWTVREHILNEFGMQECEDNVVGKSHEYFLVQCQYKSSAQILNLIYLFVYLSEHKYIPHNQEHKGSPLIGLSL